MSSGQNAPDAVMLALACALKIRMDGYLPTGSSAVGEALLRSSRAEIRRRAAIVCGSCVVELYGEGVKPLVGVAEGTPVQVLADIRAERVRVEGRDRAQTMYRFRVRSVQEAPKGS
jgi:hypothetical protein